VTNRPPPQPSLSETYAHLPRAWFVYVGAVGVLALVGAADPTWAILVATLITVPVGIGALMATYGSLLFFVVVFNGLGIPIMRHHHFNPTWWVIVFKILATTFYVLAAIGNTTFIQRSLDRTRGR